MFSLIVLLAAIWIVAGILGFWGVAGAAAAVLQGLFWFILALVIITAIGAVVTGRAIFR